MGSSRRNKYLGSSAISGLNVHSNVHTAGMDWPSYRTNGVEGACLTSRRHQKSAFMFFKSTRLSFSPQRFCRFYPEGAPHRHDAREHADA